MPTSDDESHPIKSSRLVGTGQLGAYNKQARYITKVHIEDNMLRFRGPRSDLARLLASGWISSTIHFSPALDA
jgi:hypothetical protein